MDGRLASENKTVRYDKKIMMRLFDRIPTDEIHGGVSKYGVVYHDMRCTVVPHGVAYTVQRDA